MKVTAGVLSALVLLALAVPVMMLPGCGHKQNDAIPYGSTITVNPTSATWDISSGTTSSITQDFRVVTTYANSDGSVTPIPFANLVISGSLAAPAVPPAYQFYYYPGGDSVPNAAQPSGFSAQTDYRGAYSFSVVIPGPPSPFRDTIYVASGAVVGTTTIEVTSGTTTP